MERSEALRIVEALLERHGEGEAAAVVRATFEAAEAASVRASTVSEVTRALLEDESTYRLVFAQQIDAMSLFEPSGKLLLVNDSWVELYGYTREEAVEMNVRDVSAEPELTAESIEALSAGEAKASRTDVRWHRAKDGTVFPVELTCGSVRVDGRDVMYAVMRDITQREGAHRALARSEASFRGLIEGMPNGVIVHRHGLIEYMNPAARRMLGYAADDVVVGKTAIELIHPDDRANVLSRVIEMLAHSRQAPPMEERFLRTDGSSLLAEVVALHTVFDGKHAVLAIFHDVTARKEMEAQLVMNDRLASIGRLAATVGHELNNPLACILGNVALMEHELVNRPLPSEQAGRLSSCVGTMKESATRMRDIINDLRTLARGDSERPTAVDVQHILDVCLNMAEHEIRGRARVVRDYCEPVFAFATEARLGQVFLNLLVNAAQAIPEGAPEENEIRVCVGSIGEDSVSVAISDTGTGILPELLDRIFEPFFTTKEGVGTGLGLAITRRIVTSAGGSITVEPLQRGTRVRVLLPSYGAATSRARPG